MPNLTAIHDSVVIHWCVPGSSDLSYSLIRNKKMPKSVVYIPHFKIITVFSYVSGLYRFFAVEKRISFT